MGKAGERKVKDAEIALTHNFGAMGESAAVHIFKEGGIEELSETKQGSRIWAHVRSLSYLPIKERYSPINV